MKLIAFLIGGKSDQLEDALILTRKADLSEISTFEKSAHKESFKFICRSSVKDLPKGTRHQVIHDQFRVYIQMDSKKQLGAYAIVQGEYPSNRLIYQFLNECLSAFNAKYSDAWEDLKIDKDLIVTEIDELFKKYQDPKNVDKVFEAQGQVDELQEQMHENIKMLLERQGHIEDVIDKSKDLKDASKLFLKNTQKMNQGGCCCTIY